jgi:hypothetical protein
MNPWDFTLYKSDEGSLVMKVMFSEGNYKIDIGRYFMIATTDNGNHDIEELKRLAERIRSDYPDAPFVPIDSAIIEVVG